MYSIKRIFYVSALALLCRVGFSQSFDNNWVFGDSVGLTFTTGEPVFFKSGISQTFEACASITDNLGSLLFYTNGYTVWDKFNNALPNGNDLEIGYFTMGFGSSITQGVLFAPVPEKDSLFYIFYLSRNDEWDGGIGIKYALINTNLNGGLGDIVEKNISLSVDTLTEKLQLVKHGNGKDWWLMAITKGEDEGDNIKFVKFLITAYGIEGPYYQDYPIPFHSSDGGHQYMGYMKFSRQGDKVCIAKETDADIFDFDRCTGEFFNFINIDTIFMGFPASLAYGIEFSANGRYLYIASYGFDQPFIYQFSLISPLPIEQTKYLIYAADTLVTLLGMSIGADNKIYLSSESSTYLKADSNLYVINNPDSIGLLCDLDTLAIPLGGLSLPPFSGLPNMPNYNLGPLVGSECDTSLPIQTVLPTVINIYPNPSTGNIFISGTPNDLYTLTLYNLLGEKVFEQKNAPGNVQINLPVDNGIYEVVLRSADNIIRVEKLIIGK